MNELVSVIVPVYNTSQYLEKCLNSLYLQKYKNIEVIMVDDGSTDNSLNICKKWARKDKRFSYYTKKNSGVSATRNYGIEKSTGKYITFIDSDDYIETDYLLELINSIKESDISICNYYNGNYMTSIPKFIGNKEEIFNSLFYHGQRPYLYYGYIWGKLFKNELIKKSNLKFNTSISYNEDRLFVFQYLNLENVNTVSICEKCLYHYVIHEGSAMTRKVFDEKNMTEYSAFEIMLKESKSNKISNYIKYEIFNNACHEYHSFHYNSLLKYCSINRLLKLFLSKDISILAKIKLIKYYMLLF